jgi:hypothetical protein
MKSAFIKDYFALPKVICILAGAKRVQLLAVSYFLGSELVEFIVLIRSTQINDHC